jgi:lipopolysaccharide transport system ATP-binding protein
VNLDIAAGDRVGIIGRNGAGKSTLLKILSRITEPTRGRVEISGRVASLLEVGTGFHPELSGRENVLLSGAVLGMSRAEIRRKFDDIVEFAEVEQFLDTPVKRYSSGMYVRLAFAVAAHLEPDVLIVDEVLAVGDAEFQKRCIGRMESISRQQGRTILFVSHNLSAVSTFCNKGLLLENGQVRHFGEVDQAINRYLAGSASAGSGLEWSGSEGDENLQLKRLQVEAADGSGNLVTDQDIRISLEFEVLQRIKNVVVGIHLWSVRAGELAFSAQFDDEQAGHPVDFAPGMQRCTVTIPAHTLSQGDFVVMPNLGVHNVVQIVDNSVRLEFRVNNINGLGRRFLGGRGLEDIFRPSWRWQWH